MIRRLHRSPLAALALCILLPLAASLSYAAAPLAGYNFNDKDTLAPTWTGAGLTASPVTWGDFGGTPQGNGSYFWSAAGGHPFPKGKGSGNLAVRVATVTKPVTRILHGTEDDAVKNNTFASLTLTPDAGNKLNLANLTAFVAGLGADKSIGPFAATFLVRTSLDNYQTTVGTPLRLEIPKGDSLTGTLDIDLSAPAFQAIDKPVTLRVYFLANMTGGARSSAAQILRLDQLVVNGTVTR
ncbi:hypothetical protein OPIT5_24395 [Opitutaceae bacterium TAV5]|nr:hypothetical protein OPIT5_24395 [Opitutaceae bacterium TAV5]